MPWPVSETYIDACEQTLGCKLPESYREGMMALNGGTVVCAQDEWGLHPIWDKSDKKRLKRTAMDVARETKEQSRWTGWPSNAICIAGNGSGDVLVFLSANGVCQPEVLRWSHETGALAEVAKDFSLLRLKA